MFGINFWRKFFSVCINRGIWGTEVSVLGIVLVVMGPWLRRYPWVSDLCFGKSVTLCFKHTRWGSSQMWLQGADLAPVPPIPSSGRSRVAHCRSVYAAIRLKRDQQNHFLNRGFQSLKVFFIFISKTSLNFLPICWVKAGICLFPGIC